MGEIPAEIWKAAGTATIDELSRICKDIYKTGKWPRDHTQVVMIPLLKKVGAVHCEDIRTISLISHANKIILRILTKRIENKVRTYIGENQDGFKSGCGTRDAIGVMRMLSERSLEFRNEIYVFCRF